MVSRSNFWPKLLLLLSFTSFFLAFDIQPGYIFNGSDYTPCPPGTFQNSVVCEPCPAGYFCPDYATIQPEICQHLKEYSLPGAVNCQKCTDYQYSINGVDVINTSSLSFDSNPINISDIYDTSCYINGTACDEQLTTYLSVFDYPRAYAFIPESDMFTKTMIQLHIAIDRNDTETITLLHESLIDYFSDGVVDYTTSSLFFSSFFSLDDCYLQLNLIATQLAADKNYVLTTVTNKLGSPAKINKVNEKANYDEYLATHGYIMTPHKSDAANALGLDYLLGNNGRLVDIDKAEELFTRSAAAGNPEAHAYLAYVNAVKGKKEEACQYYRKASNNGVPLGMLGYSECLLAQGKVADAIDLLTLMDNINTDPGATAILAAIYHGSYGEEYIDRDLELRYTKLSASAGNAIASYNLVHLLSSDNCKLAHDYFALTISSMAAAGNQALVSKEETYNFGLVRASFMGSLVAMRRLHGRDIPGVDSLLEFLLTTRATEPALRFLYKIDKSKEHMVLAANAGTPEARFDSCWKYGNCDYNDPAIRFLKIFRVNYGAFLRYILSFLILVFASFAFQRVFFPFKEVELTPNYEIPARFRDVINNDGESEDDDPELRAALARSMEEF